VAALDEHETNSESLEMLFFYFSFAYILTNLEKNGKTILRQVFLVLFATIRLKYGTTFARISTQFSFNRFEFCSRTFGQLATVSSASNSPILLLPDLTVMTPDETGDSLWKSYHNDSSGKYTCQKKKITL
jgi:hypothetical protein